MAAKDILFPDSRNFINEVDEGTDQSLSDIDTKSESNQDALVNELKQPPVPILLPRRVR